jgi:hypothetical protein
MLTLPIHTHSQRENLCRLTTVLSYLILSCAHTVAMVRNTRREGAPPWFHQGSRALNWNWSPFYGKD